jgi:hypothetical protein
MKPVLTRSVVAASLLTIALIASGCGKSTSSTGPDAATAQSDADDVASQSVLVLDQIGLDLEGAVAGVDTGPVESLGPAPISALWDSTFTRDGITIEASRNFYDAQDNPLPRFGPTAVRLVWTSRVYGTVETQRDTAIVGHSASMEFRGIQPADTAAVISGTALDTLANRFRSLDGTRTRHFYWNSALTIADVVMHKSAGQNNWPLSGTVTFTVQADRLRSNDRGDVEAHLTATVVVTFNGTKRPAVVVNRRYYYHWNMQTGELTRA